MPSVPVDGGLTPRRERRTREERAALRLAAALASTVVLSAMAIGAVHRATLLVVAAASLGTAALAVRLLDRETRGDRGAQDRARLVLPSVFLLGLAAITALQAVPLPARWLAAVAPSNADVWSRALLPLGESVRWASISLDPRASLSEAIKLCTYAMVIFAAATLASNRARRAWPAIIVFGSAVLVALATSAHDLAGAERVFGLYAPVTPVVTHHLGPLLNPNNLAGYLNLGLFCGIGLALMREPIVPPWAVGVGAATLIAVEIRSASRGAVLLLPVGLLLVAGLMAWARMRHRSGQSRQAVVVLAGAVVSGTLLAVLGGTLGIWRELFQDNLSKLGFVPWTFPLVADYKWVGVGRGAFESAFPAYRLAPGSNTVFTHPENFPIQWISEWGIPVGLVVLLSLAWMLRPAAVGATRSGLAAGCWVAVVVLLVQNLVDLGVEIPGVAIALSTVVGALWGMRTVRHADRVSRVSTEPRTVLRVAGALAAITCVGLLLGGLSDVRGDREALRKSYEALKGDDVAGRAKVWSETRTAMMRHPADYYFSLVGATMAWRFRERDPMPWLQRALERAPLAGRTHLLLAEVLASRGATQQALFELRVAAQYEPPLVNHTGRHVARWAKNFDDVMRAVPDGPAGPAVLDLVASLAQDPTIARKADAALLERDPDRVSAHVRIAEIAISGVQQDREQPHVCTDRAACELEVVRRCDAIARAKPQSALSALLRSRMLVAKGDPAQADRVLAAACELPDARSSCLEYRATVLVQLRQDDELDAVLKSYVAELCGSPRSCADAHTWIANIRASRGELALAIASLRRAAVEDPSDERWLRVADMGDRAGRPQVVVDALERVAHRRGADPQLQRRLQEARRTNAGRHVTP